MPSSTRRELLKAAGIAGTAVLAGCSSSIHRTSNVWTQFGYDEANTNAAISLQGPTGSQGDPRPKWVHTGGGYGYRSQILVAGAVVADTDVGGIVLSPTDGTVRWSTQRDTTLGITPVIPDKIVFSTMRGFDAVAPNGGYRFFGHRFDYHRWQTAIDIESPATITEQYLIAGSGIQGKTKNGGRVIAVNRSDGSLAWTRSVDSTVWGAPAVNNGLVYVAQRPKPSPPTSKAAIYALNVHTGAVQWKQTLGPNRDPVDAPVARQDLIYVSTTNGPLLAVEASSGRIRWRLDPPKGVRASPALADGTLYVGDLNGTFHALDAKTGESQWTQSVGRWWSGPVIGKNAIFAVAYDGTVVSWRPNGVERWRIQIDAPVAAPPTIINNRLYIGTVDGLLYCLS